MDLIETLAGQLGIEGKQAKALAGSIMGMVQQSAKDGGDDGQTAAAFEAAVPELDEWKQEADAQSDDETTSAAAGLLGGLLGGSGGQGDDKAGGGLAGMLGSVLGGGQIAQLVGLFAKLGIDPSKAQLVGPIITNFLKSRLSPELVSKLLAMAPFLTGGGTSAPKEGGGGGFGGLF